MLHDLINQFVRREIYLQGKRVSRLLQYCQLAFEQTRRHEVPGAVTHTPGNERGAAFEVHEFNPFWIDQQYITVALLER